MTMLPAGTITYMLNNNRNQNTEGKGTQDQNTKKKGKS